MATDTVNLSDDSLDRLATRLANIKGNSAGGGGGGGGGSSGTGAINAALDTAAKNFNPLNAALTLGGAAVNASKEAYTALEGVIKPGISTWQKLSDTGASFSNDIVGMSAAAAGSRLSLDEFAQVIKDNSGKFGGLGGNAAKGAENFAKLSKEMADSGVTDDLRKMGLTSRDINDVLALQVGMQQTVNMDNEQSRKKAIASAVALATEMDAMAKLTGVSRKEQEEIMKKAQADMQAEAKLRLLTMGKSEEEAAAIRNNYYTQQKEAELRGQGQMFKEVFATGTVQSEEAANQVAISGKEAQATIKAAQASQRGDAEEAKKWNEQARIENSLNQKDANKLQLATIGDSSAAGKTMMESMSKNAAMYKAENEISAKLEREGKLAGLDAEAKQRLVHAEAIKQVELEQTNKNADGTDKAGSKSTEAIVKLGAASDDVKSALMNNVAKPINEKVGPALNKLADTIIPSQVKSKSPTTGKEETVGRGEAYNRSVASGMKEGALDKTPGSGGILGKQSDGKGEGYFGGNELKGAGSVFGTGGDLLVKGIDGINEKLSSVKGHAEGTTTNGAELAVIGEAGKEHVIPDDKMQTLMQNVKLDGLTTATEALTKGKESGGIDMASMSKLVDTTVSSATSPGAGKSSVTEDDSKQYTEQWKKNYAEQNVIMLKQEKTQAQIDIEFDQEIIAKKSEKIKELKDIEATRDLTDEEKKELTKAEKRKARAEQNLASDQARLDVLNDIDKNGLANQAKMAEDFQTAQARFAEIQATSSEEEQAAKEQAVNELNALAMAAYGDSTKEQSDKIKEIKDMTTDELIKRDMENAQNSIAKVKDVKDMTTDELIKRDMENAQNSTAKVKETKSPMDFFGDMFADIAMPNFDEISSKATKINPPKEENKTSPKAAAQAVKSEEKKAEEKKAEAKKEEKPAVATVDITLKDLHTSLEHLNKSMAQMINYSQQTATAAQAQVKATKSLSSNKFA